MLHFSFYILLVISILIFLLSFLHCNILWNLLLFVLSVRMNRIFVCNIFLVLIFQRSFPLASYLSSFLFWTWIGWYLWILVLMCIDLFDMLSLDLSGIFFFLYFCWLPLLLFLRLLRLVLLSGVLIFHSLVFHCCIYLGMGLDRVSLFDRFLFYFFLNT